jgi:hypothetical protein
MYNTIYNVKFNCFYLYVRDTYLFCCLVWFETHITFYFYSFLEYSNDYFLKYFFKYLKNNIFYFLKILLIQTH